MDCYSKLTRAALASKATQSNIASFFVEKRINLYGFLMHVLIDNGTQSTSRFFEILCVKLGTKHPEKYSVPHASEKESGTLQQKDKRKATNYVSEHQRDWHI